MGERLTIITTILPAIHGGRTASLLQRAKYFIDNNVVNNISIVSTNYNPNYNEVYESFYSKKLIQKNVSFDNIYDYYEEKFEKKQSFIQKFKNRIEVKTEKRFEKYINGFSSEDKLFKKFDNSKVSYALNKSGTIKYHISRMDVSEDSAIHHIDVYDEGIRRSVKRLYLDNKERVRKIRYYNKGTDEVINETYLTKSGDVYLMKEYKYEKNKNFVSRLFLISPIGEIKRFSSEEEWIQKYFEEIFKDGEIIINDARKLDKPLIDTQKKINRIFQIHGSHLSRPGDETSKSKASFKYLFENIDANDVIVTLTEKQKEHIILKNKSLAGQINVIPHAIENRKIVKNIDKGTINIISRLTEGKRLDELIIAFDLFQKQVEDTKLNIYGSGEEQSHLQNLIKSKKLTNKVFLKGYTNKTDELYQQSEMFILCSKYEGLGLVLLESIANGCPVISYDICYGPSEIITENSGVLVKNGDIEGIAEGMLTIYNTDIDRKKVQSSVSNYSIKNFINKWEELL